MEQDKGVLDAVQQVVGRWGGRGLDADRREQLVDELVGLLGDPLALLGPEIVLRRQVGDDCVDVGIEHMPFLRVRPWESVVDEAEGDDAWSHLEEGFPYYWALNITPGGLGRTVEEDNGFWFEVWEASVPVVYRLADNRLRIPVRWRPEELGYRWQSSLGQVDLVARDDGLHVRGVDADGVRDYVVLPDGWFQGVEWLLDRLAALCEHGDQWDCLPIGVDELLTPSGFGPEDGPTEPFTFAALAEQVAGRTEPPARRRRPAEATDRQPHVPFMSTHEAYELALALVEDEDRRQVLLDRAPGTEVVRQGRQQGVCLPGSDWVSGVFSFKPSAATVELVGPNRVADGEQLRAEAMRLASMLEQVPGARLVGLQDGSGDEFMRVLELGDHEEPTGLFVGTGLAEWGSSSSHWFRIAVNDWSQPLLEMLR